MLIAVENLRCTVADARSDETAWIDDILSFEQKRRPGARPFGDGRTHLYSRATQKFPTGFLPAVLKYAQRDDVKIEVLDKRVRPAPPDESIDISWLRSYQRAAVDRALERERGVFWHVTSAGKTEVAAALTKRSPTLRVLFAVHRLDLLEQTAARFLKRDACDEVGMIGDGVWNPKRVTVASLASLYTSLHLERTKKFLRSIDLVMFDEAHTLPAGSHYRVAMSMPNAFYRYGFSGTPFARGDQKSLYLWGATGPVIHRVSAEELITAGVVAQPTIHMLTCVQVLNAGARWDELYRRGVVESKPRNQLVLSAIARAAKPCLVFVKSIDHGRILEQALRTRGENVEFVWGSKSTAVRKAAIRRLVHGDTNVLIANVIFQEGIDIPELQSLVIAAGGKSIITVLQDVGRGMRRHDSEGRETKSAFQVFDILDRGTRQLARHANDRLAAYAIEKYPVIQEST